MIIPIDLLSIKSDLSDEHLAAMRWEFRKEEIEFEVFEAATNWSADALSELIRDYMFLQEQGPDQDHARNVVNYLSKAKA